MQLLYRINMQRHDDPDGHPRPRDGRQDAQARDPARGRPPRPRRAPRRVHGRDETARIRLLVSEAWRSLGANLSTTVRRDDDRADRHVPARPLDRARHWTVSWSNHVKQRARRQDRLQDELDKGGRRRTRRRTRVARQLAAEPARRSTASSSSRRQQALAADEEDRARRSSSALPFNPFPDSIRGDAEQGRGPRQALRDRLHPLAARGRRR